MRTRLLDKTLRRERGVFRSLPNTRKTPNPARVLVFMFFFQSCRTK
jgi:hypothetical protein